MKKTYQLQIDGRNRDRLLDAAKHDIRRYLKRERAKALPAGADVWDFDCKCGASPADATVVTVTELISAVDTLARGGAAAFYVEVLARAGQRPARHVDAPAEAHGSDARETSN